MNRSINEAVRERQLQWTNEDVARHLQVKPEHSEGSILGGIVICLAIGFIVGFYVGLLL